MSKPLPSVLFFFLTVFISVFSVTDLSSQYLFNNYTTKNGLASEEVTFTFRDRRGFLWIGTNEGLQVYNGNYFRDVQYQPTNENSLSGNMVLSVAEDKNGFIWVGTNKGICKIHPGHLGTTRFIAGKNMPEGINDAFSRIIADQNGRIWCITSNALLVEENNRLVFSDTLWSHGYMDASSPNDLYLASGNSIRKKNVQSGTFTAFIPPVGNRLYTAVYCDPLGYVWAGSWGSGLYLFDPHGKEIDNFMWDLDPLNPSTTNIILTVAGDGSKIYAGGSNGIFVFDNSRHVLQPVEHILYDKDAPYSILPGIINHIVLDRDKNIWVSTSSGLSSSMHINQCFSRKVKNVGMLTDVLYTRDTVVFTSWYGNGTSFLNKDLDPLFSKQHLPENSVDINNSQISGIDLAPDGNFWIATFNGLVEYDAHRNKTLRYITIENSDIPTNRLNDVWCDPNGKEIWVANYDYGISIYNKENGSVRNLTEANSKISDRLVWGFHDTKRGDLWILTNSSVVNYRYANGTWRAWNAIKYNNKEVKFQRVLCVFVDSKGVVWVGSENGLFILIHNTWYFKGPEHGLPEREVNGIVEDSHHIVWITFPHTLAGYDQVSGKTYIFSSESGTILPEMRMAFTSPSGKELFVVSQSDVYQIDQQALIHERTSPPKVYLESFMINGVEHYHTDSLLPGMVDLDYSENTLSLRFSSSGVGTPGDIWYSYSINGSSWSSPTHTGELNLINLAPGSYSVRLRSSVKGTDWSEEPTTLAFVIHPPFWLTWWFKTILFLLVLVSSFWLIRWITTFRMRKKINELKRQKAIEEERSRLSRDMHDDLGSGLTKISILGEVARNKMKENAEVVPYLDQISESSRELVQNLNNIVWSLNTGNDTLYALVAYIREYASKFLENSGVELEFQSIDSYPDVEVSEHLKRNVYLVIKEALNNAVKHGKADHLDIRIQRQRENEILVNIRDNGIGFSVSGEVRKGNGLKNMKKRVEDIGGTIEITSVPGNGTQVQILLLV